MIYLINNSVVFTEKDNTLAWVNRPEEAISLSQPVAKLLKVLLINPGIALSKEYLLTEVLEKNSLAPSVNNLNNYISLLRKSLREYDLAGLLVTVPKIGIMFNTLDIEVTDDAPQDTPPQRIEIKRTTHKKQFLFIVGLSAVVFSLFFMFIFSTVLPNREIFRDDKITSCHFSYLDDDSLNDGFPEKYHYLCRDDVNLYYFSRKITIPKIATREETIIISCKKEGKRCSTYVFINN
ncbi:winged helix-turn-helix domain-containing protein [Lonsdalea iberica]|uniref:OmpR/PhoB-type domain-containing protein n=1 Tax=Lonsdalea iberica TaxID=1082703 RepID=A0A1X3RS86_9GAMM|nr:winged helix-turn-helix domain-containing protein [Lonsdalea iberica]OSN04693.1 hypothetical protein AU511_11890 [Lonsdalea iberica]